MSRPPDDVRFGNHGSVSINYTTGQWYDFENKRGGGIKELIRVYKEIDDRDAAIAYAEECRQNFENDEKPRPNGNAKGGQHHQREVEATYSYCDASGQVAFEVVRSVFKQGKNYVTDAHGKRIKTFCQRRPSGNPTGVGCGDSRPASSCARREERIGSASTPPNSISTPPPRAEGFQHRRAGHPLSAARLAEGGRRRPDDLHRRRREEGRPHSQLRFSGNLLRRGREEVETRAHRVFCRAPTLCCCRTMIRWGANT